MSSNHEESMSTVELANGGGSVLTNGGVNGSSNDHHQRASSDRLSGGDGIRNNNNDNAAAPSASGSVATLRQGTISSARFNILCTMVGGGCLSLPMAFQKTGNGLLGPILLILTAMITEFIFRIICASARKLSPVNATTTHIGKDSFESLASATFGPRGFHVTKWLVTAVCFFGAVAYAVLLRDMLQPIADAISGGSKEHLHDYYNDLDETATSSARLLNDHNNEFLQEGSDGPSMTSNLVMLTVVLIITPVCCLKNLSSLEKLGAVSMSAILILGLAIVIRSVQCNLGHPYGHDTEVFPWKPFQLWPDSLKDVLDAFPLFVSFYVCHYNIPAVHNELQNPTEERVSEWLRSTTVAATMFYMIVGLAGSAYGHCTPTGKVQGNVLLDFEEDDPLLLVARMCLAITITLAFPLLVIPAGDIILRSFFGGGSGSDQEEESNTDSLREPLLDHTATENGNENNNNISHDNEEEVEASPTTQQEQQQPADDVLVPLPWLAGTACLVLWSATAVACCVKSIDVVWDLLGSSVSIFISYLIPCAAFVVIVGGQSSDDDENNATEAEEDNNNNDQWKRQTAVRIAKGMICIYVPLMLISMSNAIIDTFFKD